MKRIFTSVLLLFSTMTAAVAQTEVAPFHPGVTTDGISYFLPRTALHITLQVERTQITPGEYAIYAQHFLRIDDAPQEATEKWEIKSISVTPYGVADPTKAFTIRLKPKTAAPLVTLTPDGVLLAVNAECGLPEALSQPSITTLPTQSYNPADYKTPEILAAASQRKAAELTAAEIYDIRDNRNMLNKGQADFMPKDGEQLRLMQQGLDTQEAALLQLFRGTTSTSHITYTLDICPEDFTGKAQTLFRFSPLYGLCAADDLSGAPYTISFTDLHTLPAEEPTAKPAKKELEDLRYSLASDAAVRIANPDGQELYSATIPFAQTGRIEHLGGDLFNKKYTTHVLLHPYTGGIHRIDMAEEK